MPIKKNLEIIFGAFATGLGIKSLTYIDKIVDPSWLALILSALLGSLIFSFLKFLYSLPMKFSILRKFIDRKYGIEGYWFEMVDNTPEHPYSFAWIEYRPEYNTFLYNGRNFTEDLKINARWQSSALTIDEKNDIIHFLSDADKIAGPENIRGSGFINFSNLNNHIYTTASGSFIDDGCGNQLKKRTFSAERISNKKIKSIIGKKVVHTDTEILDIVKKIATKKT